MAALASAIAPRSFDGIPGRIRTDDPLLRRQLLATSFETMRSHS